MVKFYLGSCGVNKNQELVLNLFCEAIWGIQLNNEPIISFGYEEMEITNPFYDTTGRFLINPIEEYGEDFLNSEFVTLAKSIKIGEDEPYERVQEELANLLTSKLGLKSEKELVDWLRENEVTI